MTRFRVFAAAAVLALAVLILVASQGGLAGLIGSGESPSASTALTRLAGDQAASPARTPSITPTPELEVRLTESTVKQYGHVEVSASGFTPGETVVVSVMPDDRAQPVELGRAQADSQGSVDEIGADLPEAVTSGTKVVTAAGETSGRAATAALYVRSEKLFAVIDNYTPRPTEKLGFVAGGFEPGEEVQVYFGVTTGQPVATIPTDPAGNTTWTELETPVVQPGEYELVLLGSQGTNKYVQRLTVIALTPMLELSPWSGPPGSQLSLNGRGFLADEEVQVFLGRGQQSVVTFRADQWGNYWGIGPLVVPLDAGAGKLDVQLVGQRSGASVTQQFSVVGGKPWAELSAYSGLPGSVVSFSGGGFGAMERISVHLGNGSGPIVATAQTDEAGNVIRSTPAPVAADPTATQQASVTFTLVGESSRSEASAVFTVIPPVIPSFGGERRPQP